MDFAIYNVTYIHVLTSMLTSVCTNNRIILVFTTEFKKSPIHIISFIITTLKHEKHPCKHVRVDEYGGLKNQQLNN